MTNLESANQVWKLKFQRAIDLRDQLLAGLKEYQETNPMKIEESEWSGHVLKVNIYISEQPPRKLSPILGDVVHNLRSSLDSLLFQIATVNSRRLNKKLTDEDIYRLAFPIKQKVLTEGDIKGFRKFGNSILLGDIQKLQPSSYINEYLKTSEIDAVTSGHPLAILQKLSNIDKHRNLHPVFNYLDSWAVGTNDKCKLIKHEYLEITDEKIAIKFSFECDDQCQKPSFQPFFKIGILDPNTLKPRYSLTELIETLANQVSYVINTLEPHLDSDFYATFVEPNSSL